MPEDIVRYRKWLLENAQRDCTQQKEETAEYIWRATQSVVIRNQEIRSFSPFNDELSALRTFLPWQVIALLGILLLVGGGIVFMADVTFLILSSVLASIPMLYHLTLFILSSSNLLWSAEIKIDDEIVHALADAPWPTYTILCPLYREATVARQLVHGLQKLDYPTDKLQILILLEEDDHETREAFEQIALPAHFFLTLLPPGKPRTKPRSCNYGLLNATGEYIVIYDAEDMPDPLQLKKAVLAFADCASDVVCIQAKLNFYNSHQNLLTHWFTSEYSARYDLTLPALQKANLTIPLGGTSNHFRTVILRKLGAWDIYNVTEDCDLGIRLAHSHFKTAIVDSTTYEEANSQLNNWVRQRSRWLKGFMQTYLVYMRNPWQYVLQGRWREFLSLQFLLLTNVVGSVANPFLWLLLSCSLLFYVALGDHLFMLTSIISAIGIFVSSIVSMFLAFIGCMKRRQYDLLKWIFLHPLYLFLIGWAGLIAGYQLVFRPHYWEKTNHGKVLYEDQPH
jgi:cellulose synthase/poly-beta-1,6-N-acetylglucosamine synthase-like glycosyltransferase